jgi:DNA-binding CsgD family transcriptional regulator
MSAVPQAYREPMVRVRTTIERLERLCSGPLGERSLREQTLVELRRLVSFDAYVWLLTDPVTAVGVSPVADVPSFAELPTTVRLKYLTAVNRWTRLAADDPVAFLRRATGDDPARSLLWRDLLRRYGIGDVASVVFADQFGTWAFLDLWRAGPDPFSPADLDLLRAFVGILTPALRARQAATFATSTHRDARELGPVVIVLDDELEVFGRTAASEPWLEALLAPGPGEPVVPASVYNVAAQLLAVEHGIDRNAARSRAHLAGGVWVTLRAARLASRLTSSAGSGLVAVTIEESTAAERAEVFALAFGLSRRERELLALLPSGRDTRRLARELSISPYTVQDHLRSIFAKTGAPTRQELVARATGR